MTRTRRIALSLAAAVGGLAAVLGPMPAAHAASVTYTTYRYYFTPASQMTVGGTTAGWVNRDTVAHHLVAYTARSTAWSFDVVLQPGQGTYQFFQSGGRYLFRDVNHSRLATNIYGNVYCVGQCGSVAVRAA